MPTGSSLGWHRGISRRARRPWLAGIVIVFAVVLFGTAARSAVPSPPAGGSIPSRLSSAVQQALHARYLLRVNALVQRGSKLTGSGEPGGSEFGWSVTLSADGKTALIGGPYDDGFAGAAWVFVRTGAGWVEQGPKLTGRGEAGDGGFGFSVALSANGDTAVVGGPLDKKLSGAAWVFVRSGSTWRQQGSKLTGRGQTGDAHFGSSVALAADGDTALVGGPEDNAAWVFGRSGSAWKEQGARLAGRGETGNGAFGSSVALSADGGTALIGGPYDNHQFGAAWVFTRASSGWLQQGRRLTGGGESGHPQFGSSVALSADGDTALVGGPADVTSNYRFGNANDGVGAAWVFARSGSTWRQQGKKLAGRGETDARQGDFGAGVALSADGSTALIGGDWANAAWVFTRSGVAWVQRKELKASGASGFPEFGRTVALSADGKTALAGGRADTGGAGAAWAFTGSRSVWRQQGKKLTGSGEAGGGGTATGFGFSVALSADGTTALVGDPHDNSNVGAAWVFKRRGATWRQEGEKLTAHDENGDAEFGTSLALSADGSTALIGGPYDNHGNIGAAWVFTRTGSTWTQGARLTGGGEVGADFGSAVALSADGDTALIGGPSDNNGVGAVWTFIRSGATWSQEGSKIAATDETGDRSFGFSVALSADGDTALVGGTGHDAAWVFVRSGTGWTQQGTKLEGSGQTVRSSFGSTVALSADGTTALFGDDEDDADVGAAWVFTRSGSTWTQQGPKLTAGDEAGYGAFGSDVALSANGDSALIGGLSDNHDVGAAWVFARAGSSWAQQGVKLVGGGENGDGSFGSSVSLSGDGRTALTGGDRDNGGLGAAWVFNV